MTEQQDKKALYEAWQKDPNNYKFGIFYFNKADKRIFPPKKIKQFGWTINFANPWSIVALVIVLALISWLQYWVK